MRKFLPFLTIAVFIAIIASVFVSMAKEKQMTVVEKGNKDLKPLEIKLNHAQDTYCGMTITQLEGSAQAIFKDGKTLFFDDTGCMALWFKDIENKNEVNLYVYAKDTKRFVSAQKAFYDRTSKTVMGYGFGAYENKQNPLLNFDEMLDKMYSEQTLKNPNVRKALLGE